jgi:putative alpha-1,2-mannosidase
LQKQFWRCSIHFKNFFVLTFDKEFEAYGTWSDDEISEGISKNEGKHVGAILKFRTAKGEKIHVKVASSFISLEQAAIELNS